MREIVQKQYDALTDKNTQWHLERVLKADGEIELEVDYDIYEGAYFNILMKVVNDKNKKTYVDLARVPIIKEYLKNQGVLEEVYKKYEEEMMEILTMARKILS